MLRCMPLTHVLKRATRRIRLGCRVMHLAIIPWWFVEATDVQAAEAQLLMPRLLPAQQGVVFSLYGMPGDPVQLESLIAFMKQKHLGNGFDPGPGAGAQAAPLLEIIAENRWPVVCYPPHGGAMQVKGGPSVLDPEGERAMRIMDRTGGFAAIQLGEWGYHFHRLTSDRNWWKAVLGSSAPEVIEPFFIPAEQRGFDPKPTSREACYHQLREYFYWHRQAKAGRLISVTGHSHYEAYAAEWGASAVGLEVGENIGFTQSKFAFARGASRQWNIPWTVQVSPWFGPSVTTRGALQKEGSLTRGLDAGHSLSLYKRLWLHAWFAGAAMVTPENSINIFFDKESSPWVRTSHGLAASDVFKFMQSHDRGNPYTPLLIVLDHLAGYAPFHERTWGVLERTQGDWEIFNLLERQLYFSSQRLPYPNADTNPEASYLHPTPYGEIADVMLNTVAGATMARYPSILLAGEMRFSSFFIRELEKALLSGSECWIHPRHAESLGEDRIHSWQKTGRLHVIQPPATSQKHEALAIHGDELRNMTQRLLPVAVSGDPIQYQINRNQEGWVVELINNDGVFKTGDQPARIHSEATAKVVLKPNPSSALTGKPREWVTDTTLTRNAEGLILVAIPPGESRFVFLPTARVGAKQAP